MPGNISVAVSQANITVDETNTTVSVASTTSNVIVGESLATSNADIRSALGNVSPILYDSSTGIFSFSSDLEDLTLKKYQETIVDNGTTSGNISVDIAQGTIHQVTLNANITGITLANISTGGSATLEIFQDGTGGRYIDTTTFATNWTNWKFLNDNSLLSGSPNKLTILTVIYDGNYFVASVVPEEDLGTSNFVDITATGNITAGGNVTAGNLVSTGNVTGSFFFGDGSTLSNLPTGIALTDLSVTQASASGSGTLSYNNTSGVFTYTPPDLTSFGLTNAQAQAYIQSNGLDMTANISTTSNIASTGRILIGSDTFLDDVSNDTYNIPHDGPQLVITPESTSDLGSPPVYYFSSRTDASGNPLANTSQYGTGYLRLIGSGGSNDNRINLSVGKNQSNAGGNNIGLQAEFHSQNTSSGTSGVYTNGGYRTQFDFFGDTRITGPNQSGNYGDNDRQAIIEGFNISAWSLESQSNALIGRNITAGANADSLHSFTGNVNVTGNIEVDGNLNYRNVTDLYVTDQKITLNANAASDATVQIIANRPVAGTDAVLQWNETVDKWQINPGTGSYSNIAQLSDISTTNTVPTTEGFGSLSYDGSTGVLNFTESRPDATFLECFAGALGNPGVTRGDLVAICTPPHQVTGSDLNQDVLAVFPADAGNIQHRAFGISNVTASSYTQRALIITSGRVTGLDTSAFRAGDTLFMSTTEGVMSNVAPTFASNVVIQEIGKCIYSDATNGIIHLNIQESNTEDLTTSGNITATGNVSGAFILGDGSQLSNLPNGLTNAQAQAFIEANGLDMTAAITSDSNIETTAFFEGDLNGAVTIDVNNNTGGTLTKGQAVYLTGGNQGDNPNVALADADDVTKMPALGIVRENINDGSIGQVVTSGVMNFSSHGFTAGADLFISTTAGDLTETAPTGESSGIQKIGKVVSSNHINVQGAFRTNATPNLDENNIFIGNAANRATTVALNNLTSDIGTSGNIQLGNSSTLTFGTDTNAGQMTFEPTGRINYITESDVDHNFSVYRDGANGVNLHMYKAGGNISTPTAIGQNDFVHRFRAFGHDGTQFYDNSGAEYFVYQDDNTGSVGTDDVPLAHEFSVQRTPNTGFASSVLKMTADRRIIFNDTGVKGFGSYTGTANISADGKLHTAGNITSDGNISGSYILGNGSQLSGLSTNSFGTITVSGETNIQASQGNAVLDIASSGDITLTTSGNTLTIGGSGSGYGNAEVTTYLASGTSTGNVAFTGNLIVESGNTSYSPTSYEGNVTTGNVDRIVFSSDPGFYLGQPITFSGTTNSNLVFLNGNTYYVRASGVSDTYDLLTDPGLTIGLTSGLGTETPNGLAGSVRDEDNNKSDFFGNVNISRGSTLNVDNIESFTPGGTFSMNGIRASDVALGSGGNNFFFPETGGNTRGGILVAQNDSVGVWEQGYKAEVLIASPITSNVTMLVNSSTGIHEKHRKARDAGSQVPGILSNNDRIHEVEYHGHDGVAYQNTFMEHVYVDGDVDPNITANVVPLTKEFMTKTGGDVNAGFMQSIVKFTADRTIIFNDTGTRNFGNYQGNANITQDGSINSVSTITGLNIKSDQFLQLKNYSNTEILALSGMAAGDVVFNSTDNTIAFYEGSNWKNLTVTGNVT